MSTDGNPSVSVRDSLSKAHQLTQFIGRNRVQISRSWASQGPSRAALFESVSHPVHRIKVDEKAGYVITTSSAGGMDIVDLQSDELLWRLLKVCTRLAS